MTSILHTNVLKVRVTKFPPQYYQDNLGQWTGLDVELARSLVEKADFIPEFVDRPWSRSLEEMKNGKLHIMMNLSQTPERTEFMEWIGPERYAQMVLVVKKENVSLPIQKFDDFISVGAQKKIQFGIQKNAFYSQEFNDRLENQEFAQWFYPISDANLNPSKTIAGRILGFFEDRDSVKYKLMHDPEYANLAEHPFALAESPVYFGISKAGISPEILARLQKAYTELEKDGTFKEIREKTWK
jgi:ABC-type amino acid transport substrate-binding protein